MQKCCLSVNAKLCKYELPIRDRDRSFSPLSLESRIPDQLSTSLFKTSASYPHKEVITKFGIFSLKGINLLYVKRWRIFAKFRIFSGSLRIRNIFHVHVFENISVYKLYLSSINITLSETSLRWSRDGNVRSKESWKRFELKLWVGFVFYLLLFLIRWNVSFAGFATSRIRVIIIFFF